MTRTTYTDKETSVGASGKHKEKEVEMIPRVKQKQNVTIKDEASNKAENEEMDTLLNSIPPDWGERQQKQTVKSGQTYFPPYTEPAFTEYNTDAERWMTMQ